ARAPWPGRTRGAAPSHTRDKTQSQSLVAQTNRFPSRGSVEGTLMKWLLIGAGVITACVVVIVIIGALLPRDHTAAMAARVAATPEAVWTALTTPADFPSWRPEVKTVDVLAPTATGPSWREHSRNGAITF